MAGWSATRPENRPTEICSLSASPDIAELYPNHIWKEDYLLFPMTGKILNFGEQQDLWRRFEEVEAALGRDLHQRFERFAEELYQSTQGAPGGESGNLR